MGLKAEFITALRNTPDGIAGFTTTVIPTLTEIATPTTVDEAIIVQGVLAANLNLILKMFEGLTPVELLLRIGQHSNVAEALLLSGLEYLAETEGDNAAHDFTVTEPVAGTTYAQGDVRIIVTAKNGTLAMVAVTVSDDYQTSVDIALTADEEGATFYGYARCEEIGAYAFDFTATFNDEKTATDAVTVTIATESADTTNPEGEDVTAFNVALSLFDEYYQKAIQAAVNTTPVAQSILDNVSAAAKSVVNAGAAIGGGGTSGGGGASGSWDAGIMTDLTNAVKELIG